MMLASMARNPARVYVHGLHAALLAGLLAIGPAACASRGTPTTPAPPPPAQTPAEPGSPAPPRPDRDRDDREARQEQDRRDRDRDRQALARAARSIALQLEDGRVVTLDLDTYVLGTVAAESWVRRDEDPDVAERIFEVQALVARTYAIANAKRHAAEGFDLCSRTHCQIYRPPPASARWREAIDTAVERTRESLIAYDHTPILALFHANCGGGTSAAHEVWGGTSRPYLVAVEDRACDLPSAHWRVSLTREALVRVLDADKRTSVGGRLDSIDVLEADRTGRVMLAALAGARSPVVRGEELRGILGRAFGARSIRSPRFTVTRDGPQFIFEGSGFGHGAGLCQFGAMTRIRAGAAARDVIEHYYPGTRIVRLRDLT
jgi:stage II sporulation protein D